MSKTDPTHQKELLTDAEYLRAVREAFEKGDYINGRIVATADVSKNHNLISSNVFLEIGIQTEKTTRRVFSSDVRVKAKKGNYYYPDIVVVCGKRKFEDNTKDVLLNPKVIIEVLSNSTKLKDHNEKLDFYMSLASLTDYVLIEQDTMRIEHFIKISEKEWKVNLLTEKAGKLILESINCQISLDEIYREVKFSK